MLAHGQQRLLRRGREGSWQSREDQGGFENRRRRMALQKMGGFPRTARNGVREEEESTWRTQGTARHSGCGKGGWVWMRVHV